MITEGLGLLAAGMGMVFAFLILLVLIMNLSAKLFSRIPDTPPGRRPEDPLRSGGTRQSNEDHGEIAAAVAAAAARARAWKGRKSPHGEKDR